MQLQMMGHMTENAEMMEQMGQMVSLQQTMLFMGALTDILSRHITDRAVLGAIGVEFERLINRGEK